MTLMIIGLRLIPVLRRMTQMKVPVELMCIISVEVAVQDQQASRSVLSRTTNEQFIIASALALQNEKSPNCCWGFFRYSIFNVSSI